MRRLRHPARVAPAWSWPSPRSVAPESADGARAPVLPGVAGSRVDDGSGPPAVFDDENSGTVDLDDSWRAPGLHRSAQPAVCAFNLAGTVSAPQLGLRWDVQSPTN